MQSPPTIAAALLLVIGGVARGGELALDPAQQAERVMIHRDEFGVPHILGDDDESTIFGFGYAQAEDYFWQVEDAYILALGRYSEVHGPRGLNSDLLNRAFEIVPRSQREFAGLNRASRRLCAAFVAGLNCFLAAHPEERPRLIRRFEPWHVLAYHRHIALELCFRFTGLSPDALPRRNPQIWTATGSNAWAIRGARTTDGQPMLMAMPHMPLFGFTQLMEAHLQSRGGGEGQRPWNFTGAGFYGSPALALGHNDRLGWTLASNKPDVADLWRERFDKPDDPLAYAYDGGRRLAQEWSETIRVRKSQGFEDRNFTFRKTHHGPIVSRPGDKKYLAAQVSGLFESAPLWQWLAMARARDLQEFRAALEAKQILYMNLIYADCDGNIWFLYNGRVPRRNPKFDWSQPVDGNDPATEWLGVHRIAELPQALNPAADFVQNCNSTPWAATDGANPRAEEFPPYIVGDGDVRNRRSLRSTEILRELRGIDFKTWQSLAFDDEVPWARRNLPRYAAALQRLSATNPQQAAEVRPYLQRLLAWNCRIAVDSTEATLCQAWYELMHGAGYPGERMRRQFRGNEPEQLAALVRAAESLASIHGTSRVPYGELFRVQRRSRVADLVDARFADNELSLPCLGGHGPMGSTFAMYYTPSISIPLVYSQRRRYAAVGSGFMAAWEFTPQGVRGASLAALGACGDAHSDHFVDQALRLSQRRLKPEHFDEQDVLAHAVRSYHPGAADEQSSIGISSPKITAK